MIVFYFFFFFSSRRRHTRLQGDWSSDVCSSDLDPSGSPSSRCRSRSSAPRWARGRGARGEPVVASGLEAVASCGCAQFQADDLRELPSLHLSASGQRERVEEAHQVGHFVVGDGVAAEVLRSEEHTSELQSPCNLVCRLLLEKKKKKTDSCVSMMYQLS